MKKILTFSLASVLVLSIAGCGNPASLTQGMPVKLSAAKGEWYPVGVSVQNPTVEDITVYVTVNDVDVRIKD